MRCGPFLRAQLVTMFLSGKNGTTALETTKHKYPFAVSLALPHASLLHTRLSSEFFKKFIWLYHVLVVHWDLQSSLWHAGS